MAPTNLTIQRIEKPTEPMIDGAVKIFTSLMQDDLLCLTLCDGNRDLIPDAARAMMNPLAFFVGEMYTATDENDVMVGFTLWTAPGNCMFATPEQLEMGYLELLSKVSPECAAYHSQQIAKDYPTFVDDCIGMSHAEMAAYWCNFAFVRKDYQHKGVATALFDLVYEKAQKKGETMALATTDERNVAIYESMGFVLKGHKLWPTQWADWPVWIFNKPMKTA